ncbi:MAG: HD domain-containing phosphohydrolase, partial [Bacteriovorax sp.]|nr:HD domain-containing phosphohydrolase [Bacteriovorax sp.]
KLFLDDIFNKFHANMVGEQKADSVYEVSGLQFLVNLKGLSDIGITNNQIEKVNEIIEETINSLLNNPNSRELFIKLCESEGFFIGHSLLIIYIAGRICREANHNFLSTMKKICAASFYHDFSLFALDVKYDELKAVEITDPDLLKQVLDHPSASAHFLPANIELLEDTKKIITEHHELPNGDGYPRKLTASQIAPLSCLFILSQQISFCLIRNNFSQDRLKDFLVNSESTFDQGNFSKYYQLALTIF